MIKKKQYVQDTHLYTLLLVPNNLLYCCKVSVYFCLSIINLGPPTYKHVEIDAGEYDGGREGLMVPSLCVYS